MKRNFLVLAGALCLAFWGAAAAAQTSSGVSGSVTDATGAVVPGAKVELSGPALQGQRSTLTDSQGRYRFLNIPAGDDYKGTASMTASSP